VKCIKILLDEYNDRGLVSHNDKTSRPKDAVHFKEQIFSTATSFVKVREDCPRMQKIICSRISRECLTPANTLLLYNSPHKILQKNDNNMCTEIMNPSLIQKDGSL
jgi:hypothetical protein